VGDKGGRGTVLRGPVLGLLAGAAIVLMAKELDLGGLFSFWGPHDGFAVAVAFACALAWLTRLRVVVATAALAMAALWAVVAFTPLVRGLARDLPRRDALASADAVFVLGSRIQADGELTEVAMSRLLRALELVGEHRAGRLILSELAPPSRSHAQAARALMDSLGLHPELLVVGPIANTHDEAVAVTRLCHERGFSRLLVVTSPTHARRASAVFEAQGITVISSPAAETRFDLETLDRSDDRLRAFAAVLHERIGLWVYRRRGWVR
jgi:uncharacterized SAM-binding protein YcdF (DUF218 family)